MFIFRILNAVPYSNKPPVQDWIASLHSYFTSNLLLGFAILHSYKQFGGRPMECMTPLGFPSGWNEYTENYCFASNTYYVPFNQTIVDQSSEEKRTSHISYYQWMPFFFLFQAACFKFPTLIWKYFAGQSGVKVGQILRLATNEANGDPNIRNESIHSLTVHLQGALRFHHRLKKKRITPHKIFRILNMKYTSHYISFIYIISKMIFLVNVLCQVSLLNRYLFGGPKQDFGFHIWRNLIKTESSWHESGLFPRVTLCDFEVREMGQTQNHTVQCMLLLNIFAEKVFIVLWAWYAILGAITLSNFTMWIFSFINPRSSEHFIYNHLEMSGERVFANSSDKGLKEIQIQVDRFIKKYLRADGIFILRLIAQHADVVFTTELIYKLWESHYNIEKQREALRLTEAKWQEHLKRFEVIEERSRPDSADLFRGDKSAYSKMYNNIYASPVPHQPAHPAAQGPPPDLTDHFIKKRHTQHSPTKTCKEQASHRSPTKGLKPNSMETSFTNIEDLPRTLETSRPLSRRASYARRGSGPLRRTFSAESLAIDDKKSKSGRNKFIDSSEEDEEDSKQTSGQRSKK
ncbi:innexin domain-containing protein [Ditylenchus destructor]|uniref:Innexin n=1 Tax=Ditylenchus destructor TaxID=166010 RepID=A0AAD4R3V3_9BILA|nr:innexin domain-containing protein [Ditylenchus destructor]